jgi:hypothetical protein
MVQWRPVSVSSELLATLVTFGLGPGSYVTSESGKQDRKMGKNPLGSRCK